MAHEPGGLQWQAELLDNANQIFETNCYWRDRFAAHLNPEYSPFAIHLAVFVEPYLSFILDGTKTIESRFSRNRCPPYNCLVAGDAVFLKRSGGPITGICQVGSAWHYQLNSESWSDIRRYASALCVQSPDFWEQRSQASFATLIRVEHVFKIKPIACGKRDRRGWAVVRSRDNQPELRETHR